jgi:DNA primase
LRGVDVARDALEKEWQPVFDPRGLVGYEGRLGAEIRVLQLPGGKDPDDVIREDPGRWRQLVEEAVPVVDFYLDLLSDDMDPDDTKAKAQVVDQLMPVLRAVSNPVEREDYVQKIARWLRVDERAVLARLHSSEREAMARAYRHRERGGPPETRRTQDRDEGAGVLTDRPVPVLESHCLSMFLSSPGLLAQVDRSLKKHGLKSVQPQDFEQISLRAIFQEWATLLETRPSISVQALRAALPLSLQDTLELVLSRTEGALPDAEDLQLADDQLVRDVVVTLLRLRQHRLQRLVQDLRMLMLEAHEKGDARAKQYDQAHLAHTQMLLKTQRALARSRELA